MLPNKPQDYPNSFPARVWYTHLIEEIGDEAIEKLGFYPNERLLDTTKALVAKQDQALANFFSQRIFWGIFYSSNGGIEESLGVGNRRIIPLIWFRQIADSKFANSLKEVAKIAKSDLEQLLYEGILYQEFFELQILVKKDSIEWLKNNATKNEVLSHHGFNNMLGYKYFLKRIREGLMFSNQALENGFDEKKLPRFSEMVAQGNGAFLPCPLVKNDLHFGGGKWQIEYEFVTDGDY